MNLLVIATFISGLQCAVIFPPMQYLDLHLKDVTVDVYEYVDEDLQAIIDNAHTYEMGFEIDGVEQQIGVVCNQ